MITHETTAPALPPHVEPTSGFDADADVAKLKAAPKQDYSNDWTVEEPPIPEQPKGEKEPGATPGGDAPPEASNTDAAKEFVEFYDMMQAYSFSFYSNGLKPEAFELPKFAKDRAAHLLAKGLQLMGSPELPWWLGLTIALTPPSLANYFVAKENRANTAQSNREKAKRGEPLHPSNITRKDGSPVPFTPPPDPAPVNAPAAPAQAPAAPRKQNPNMPLCQVCGVNHVKSTKKKYCSKSCAGKGSSMIQAKRKAQASQ